MKLFGKPAALPALLCCMCMIAAAAAADVSVTMKTDEWTLEPGTVCLFTGTVSTDGEDLPGASLKLTLECAAEDPGEVQFSNLNGKKLTKRKRSDTAEIDLAGKNAENTFEAEWMLPMEADDALSGAAVRLTVSDGDGKELKSVVLRQGASGAEETEAAAAAPDETAPDSLPSRLLRILAVSSAAVWILAVSRHVFLNRNKKKRVRTDADL